MAAGPSLLGSSPSPYAALTAWIDLFVDFLITKHGLAAVLQSDDSCFDPLHTYFLDRYQQACQHPGAGVAICATLGRSLVRPARVSVESQPPTR